MKRAAGGERSHRWLAPVLTLPAVGGLALTAYAGWPGSISPDMATTIEEGARFSFYGHQPAAFGFVWALALLVLPMPAAIGMFYFAQLVGYWSAFALFALGALRRSSIVLAVLAAAAAFLPPLFGFSIMLESNMQTGVAWGLAVAITFAFPTKRSLFLSLPLIAYGYIPRSGMIFSVGPMILACLMLAEPQRRLRRAATLAAMGAVGIAVAAFLLTVLFLGSPNRNSVMAVVQLFDISGVYQQTGSHCIPPALVPSSTTAEQILSRYDPGLVGEIVWSGTNDFRLPGSPAEYASLRQCWTETVRHHPREFLWGKVRYFMIFLMVGVEFAPATDTDVSGNARVGLARPDNVLKAGMQTYVERSRDSLVWKGWFWLLLTGAACVAAGLRNRRHSVPGVALYAAVLGTLIPHALFGTTAVSRFYFLPFLLCVACLIALWPTRGDGAAAKSVSP